MDCGLGRDYKTVMTSAFQSTLQKHEARINQLMAEQESKDDSHSELAKNVSAVQDGLKEFQDFVQNNLLHLHSAVQVLSQRLESEISEMRSLQRLGHDMRSASRETGSLEDISRSIFLLEGKYDELKKSFNRFQHRSGNNFSNCVDSSLSEQKLNGMSDDRKARIITMEKDLRDIMSAGAQKAGHLALAASAFPDEDKNILYESLFSGKAQGPQHLQGPTDEFVICLHRKLDDKIGLVLRGGDDNMLIVDKIQDGLLFQYNMNNPGKAVCEGDQILAVNHKRGSPKVLTNLIRGIGVGDVSFTFRRNCDTEVIVDIKKRQGQLLGLQLDHDDTHLIVSKILSGGAMGSWNQVHKNNEIKPGDKIVCVNETRGNAEKMTQELQKDTVVLSVVRTR